MAEQTDAPPRAVRVGRLGTLLGLLDADGLGASVYKSTGRWNIDYVYETGGGWLVRGQPDLPSAVDEAIRLVRDGAHLRLQAIG